MIFENLSVSEQGVEEKNAFTIRDALNDPQWEAVTYGEGPLLVLAGAGSGKTRVITYRIWNLIQNMGIQPYKILAVTFTNKAASEMKKRVNTLIGNDARGMWICTFHSACVRILRQHIEKIGIPKTFQIVDADDQLKIMKKCFTDAKDTVIKDLRPNKVLSAISKAKNNLVSLEEYKKRAYTPYEHVVASFYQMYEQALKQQSGLDFDDLIIKVVKLFREQPSVLEYYKNLWDFILVDEYQDTNLSQSTLLDLLASKKQNLCVVGDDDQSIYQWRGAEVKNILHFEKRYPNAHTVRLEQNYRSTRKILTAAEGLIEKNYKRKGKKLWTDNELGEPVKIFTAPDEHAEAQFLSQQIKQLINEGECKGYKDFCILYRVNAQSRVIEEELRKAGIPYIIIGGIRFYERMEIKDCLAYLRIINNVKDNISLTRIINTPPRGIGKGTLDKLSSIARMNKTSLFDAIESLLDDEGSLPTQIINAVEAFYLLIKDLLEYAQNAGATEILERTLECTKYLFYLAKEQNEEAQSRKENVEELISATKDFEMITGDRSLSAFLDHVSLLTDIDTYKEDRDAVTMMTLHSSKGLEFPVVFITGVEQGLLPHERSLNSEEEREEERRLCYVGMTRAQKRLYLTNASSRNIFGYPHYNNPSEFLNAIPTEALLQESKSKPLTQTPISFIPKKASPPPKRQHWAISSSKQRVRRPKKQPEPERIPEDYKFSGTRARPEDIVEGAIVFHPQWGVGKVLQTEGYGDRMKILMSFGGIQKKLLARYANLMIAS